MVGNSVLCALSWARSSTAEGGIQFKTARYIRWVEMYTIEMIVIEVNCNKLCSTEIMKIPSCGIHSIGDGGGGGGGEDGFGGGEGGGRGEEEMEKLEEEGEDEEEQEGVDEGRRGGGGGRERGGGGGGEGGGEEGGDMGLQACVYRPSPVGEEIHLERCPRAAGANGGTQSSVCNVRKRIAGITSLVVGYVEHLEKDVALQLIIYPIVEVNVFLFSGCT
ncbi:Protein of unknown function [Gryllus bimaculatus]|nr:Protein of unknown function [Gryllus bimaculatus]